MSGVTDVSEATFEAYELVAADVGPQLVARERDTGGLGLRGQLLSGSLS